MFLSSICFPLCVSHSESVLELSIMPKDEDVLQLVSIILRHLFDAFAKSKLL